MRRKRSASMHPDFATDPRFSMLTERARFVGFHDALRLIEQLAPTEASAALENSVRLRPSLRLSFGTSDIESISQRERDGRWLLTTQFLGLYGAASPLPGSYAEQIMLSANEPGGERVREFLDILHDRLLRLAYEAGRRYFVRTTRQHDGVLGSLLTLAGASPKEEAPTGMATRPALTRLFAARARSTRGLVALLELRTQRRIEVLELERRRFAVDVEQRTRLPRTLGDKGTANVLGSSFLLGRHVFDRSGVTIRVQAKTAEDLTDFGPGGRLREQVEAAVSAFVRTPVAPALTILVPGEVAAPWLLGRGRLARDSWLGSPSGKPPRSVSYGLFRGAAIGRR